MRDGYMLPAWHWNRETGSRGQGQMQGCWQLLLLPLPCDHYPGQVNSVPYALLLLQLLVLLRRPRLESF